MYQNMNISIIIVSYNTKALLKQCLISVFEKTQGVNFEVIVVDNASQDGSQQMVQKGFPNVTLIESPANIGFGRANNLGAKYAQGKYLFFLNPDTILLNNAVKILAEFLDNNPKVGICGGNLFDENRNPTLSYKMFLPSILWELNELSLDLLAKLLYGENRFFNHTCQVKEVGGYITGADIMISRSLFDQLSGFDPDFFVYFEETELSFRVKKAGYKIYSVPQAEIIHLEGQTFSENWNRKARLFSESRKIYYKKNHTRFISLICDIIYFLKNIVKKLVKSILFKVLKE
jgi:GT2 family glycosyltransferase